MYITLIGGRIVYKLIIVKRVVGETCANIPHYLDKHEICIVLTGTIHWFDVVTIRGDAAGGGGDCGGGGSRLDVLTAAGAAPRVPRAAPGLLGACALILNHLLRTTVSCRRPASTAATSRRCLRRLLLC